MVSFVFDPITKKMSYNMFFLDFCVTDEMLFCFLKLVFPPILLVIFTEYSTFTPDW